MRRIVIPIILAALLIVTACNLEDQKETEHTVNSFELSATTRDTFNRIIDGKKQGLWLMPISKDTVVYRNDTAYSVTVPMTSGEMIRALKTGPHSGFVTYDSLVVKSN
ncbi:MAG: hypothetical protein V4677_01315 [Bacteroidota bacterium]